MAAAWQIHRDEVAIGRRLGGGGFGDVYEAKYRGMTVAVKLLREWQDAKSSYEFQREILFMQTVRHPNIVLFIGCGSTEATREPFLVLEYMSKGTLCDILYGDNPLDFSHNQKIGFALDIARGMRFLHGLNPPRIHRDLKSANLLVSDNWVVKVSDFGLGRAVTSGQQRKTTTLLETRWSKLRWSRTPSTVTVSLLNPESELSHRHVGTARWCAPELRAGGEYHVSVDVFSFGILLWEIWCHRLPFDNYPFSSAAANAINKGERPPVPTDCSPIYTALMKLCWSHNPNDRPNFVHIVASLEALQAAPAF
ncbi:uncharacterized protein LOC134182887 [Corticium candelabrum]|uniref:uncharacterized protein LOC134182887 n=1 Tax=Corticium candelabrum TaxID=121492 RepID=UPI002E256845|nr:uncharacterized protein LOC134182887 [Corticium candelabrum]